MTRRARSTESAGMRVVVTRCAVAGERQERSRLVTRGAASGHGGVAVVERKSGQARVVEPPFVEGPEYGVDAGVLSVALHTIALDITVHAGASRDARGDRRVTREAFLRRDLASRLVTLLAARDPFKRGMRPRQWPRRDERGQLRVCQPRHRAPCDACCRDDQSCTFQIRRARASHIPACCVRVRRLSLQNATRRFNSENRVTVLKLRKRSACTVHAPAPARGVSGCRGE